MDKGTFEELFRAHFLALVAYALKYIPDQDEAKEIVHQVFVNLWERRDKIDAATTLKPYLYRGVYNRCLNYLRDHKKMYRGWEESSMQQLTDMQHIDSGIETKELKDRIDNAIGSLPEKCRQVFLLSRKDDLKYKEIAVKLNISVKTVEVQMGKALKFLREALKEYLLLIFILLNQIIK